MRHVARILAFGSVMTLLFWFIGCGVGARNTQKDLLTIEVEQQQEELESLVSISDTLTNIRTQLLTDIRNLQELNSLSPEQIAVLEAEVPSPEESTLAKIGKGLKKLWPF